MTLVSDFPNELVLEFFVFLPLKSLIAARGVNRNWRCLVPLANIHPVRRELLDLYDTVITTPQFLNTRKLIEDHLRPFDREAYISSVEQHFTLPEEFRIWILEWPARAVFDYLWPGLCDNDFDMSGDLGRPHGRCCLVQCSPSVQKLAGYWLSEDQIKRGLVEDDGVMLEASGLEVWDHGCYWSDWLILDCTDVNWKDKIICAEGNFILYHENGKAPTWLAYLRRRMSR